MILGTKKNDGWAIFVFWATIVFSATGLRLIWSIEDISRLVNASLFVGLCILAGLSFFKGKYPSTVWYWQIYPAMFICLGITFNVLMNLSGNIATISFLAPVLPWLMYIGMPYLINNEAIDSAKLWRYFYYFMLVSNIAGMLEYMCVFSGLYQLRSVDLVGYGEFLTGYVSIFHRMEGGIPHYRYYGSFIEPGTLAMFLLPVTIYAFLYRRYVGAAVFLVAMVLTDSLGGLVSLALAGIIFPLTVKSKGGKNSTIIMVSIFIAGALWAGFGDDFERMYEGKATSSEDRKISFYKTIETFPVFLVDYPLGTKLEMTTDKFEMNRYYLGSNFTPAIYLQTGGVIAFFGYVAILISSFFAALRIFWRRDLSKEDRLVFSSILVVLPFIVQRTTLFESALFALLFAPTILRFMMNPASAGSGADVRQVAPS